MAKVGDRVEFGSAIEPCGGVIVSIKDEVVALEWDSGGQSVTTVEFLAMLACGHEKGPAAVRPLVG